MEAEAARDAVAAGRATSGQQSLVMGKATPIASGADAGAALVALADERLSVAKNGGGNRVRARPGDGRAHE